MATLALARILVFLIAAYIFSDTSRASLPPLAVVGLARCNLFSPRIGVPQPPELVNVACHDLAENIYPIKLDADHSPSRGVRSDEVAKDIAHSHRECAVRLVVHGEDAK